MLFTLIDPQERKTPSVSSGPDDVPVLRTECRVSDVIQQINKLRVSDSS